MFAISPNELQKPQTDVLTKKRPTVSRQRAGNLSQSVPSKSMRCFGINSLKKKKDS